MTQSKDAAEWRLVRIGPRVAQRAVVAIRSNHESLVRLKHAKQADSNASFVIEVHRLKGSSTYEPSYYENGKATYPDGWGKNGKEQ